MTHLDTPSSPSIYNPLPLGKRKKPNIKRYFSNTGETGPEAVSRTDDDGKEKEAESTESRFEKQEQDKSIRSLVLNDDVSLPTNLSRSQPERERGP